MRIFQKGLLQKLERSLFTPKNNKPIEFFLHKIYNEKGEHVGFIDVFTDKKETVFNENDNLTIFLEPPKIKP